MSCLRRISPQDHESKIDGQQLWSLRFFPIPAIFRTFIAQAMNPEQNCTTTHVSG
jgi:hypothetical protein